MRPKLSRLIILSALVVLAASCAVDHPTESSGESDAIEPPSLSLDAMAANTRSTDREFLLLQKQLPTFGGMFYGPSGELVIYLTDLRAQTAARGVVSSHFVSNRRETPAKAVRFVLGRYTFQQLKTWQDRAMPLLANADVIYTDVDETANRVRIGVDKGARLPALERKLRDLAIPRNAATFAIVERPTRTYSLNDLVRPTLGGLKVITLHTSKQCSLGFNARNGSGVLSFVTASHCTDTQGGTEGTRIYQPGVSKIGSELGTEITDPAYSTGGSCPAGQRCRFSDAALFRLQGIGASSSFEVARTTVEGSTSPGSIVVGMRLPVVGEIGAPLAGSLARKTGFSSGSTAGTVSSTCITTTAGVGFTLFCQYAANAAALPGDSGAPVYTWSGVSGTGATLAGILWGRTSTQFFFSSMNDIESELGPLTTQ
jgi:hypothetical protein